MLLFCLDTCVQCFLLSASSSRVRASDHFSNNAILQYFSDWISSRKAAVTCDGGGGLDTRQTRGWAVFRENVTNVNFIDWLSFN